MDRSPAGRAEDVGQPRRWFVVAGGGVSFVLTFLYRFLSTDLANDHFMHLAAGRQVLHGEWPVRDFFDFGLPLQILTSSAALLWSGYNLYGEVLVTCAFVAAGAALAFVVSAHLSRSIPIATAAGVITALSSPRLYNYPKVFWYVCALWLAWRYVQKPTTARLAVFAVGVALAFLYRHDHGLYIAVSSLPLFVIIHWGEPRVALVAFGRWCAIGLLVISPFLVFVQATVGLPWYLSDLVPGAQVSIAARFNALPFTVDRAQPWVAFDPPADRRISVRWKPDLDPATRAEREAAHHLTTPIADRSPNTWSYAVTDESRAAIRALVDDPAVEDTNGINRGAAELDVREYWYETLQRQVPLLRLHVLPGLFSKPNTLPAFYYLTFAIPLIGVVTLAAAIYRGTLSRRQLAIVTMSVLMSLVVVETLVRGSPDSRLPDVTGAVAVTGAWATGWWVRSSDGRVNRVRAAAGVTVFLLIAWIVGTFASAGDALITSRLLAGPTGTVSRFAEMRARLLRYPITNWAEDDQGYPGLTRYAYECTQPSDRLLVTWFEPAIYFYADRDFAGGRVFFDGGWHDSPRDQQFTVDRLRQQQVPLVFVRDMFELMYRKDFPMVAAYVDANYERVFPAANPGQIAGYQVWVAKSRPAVRTYARLGLPCFR